MRLHLILADKSRLLPLNGAALSQNCKDLSRLVRSVYKKKNMNVTQAGPPKGRRVFARGRAIPNAQRVTNIFPKYRK